MTNATLCDWHKCRREIEHNAPWFQVRVHGPGEFGSHRDYCSRSCMALDWPPSKETP